MDDLKFGKKEQDYFAIKDSECFAIKGKFDSDDELEFGFEDSYKYLDRAQAKTLRDHLTAVLNQKQA